jgi:GxxExxY protein
MTENHIARLIVDAAYHIHRRLGPGLLESVYEAVLAYELQKRGLRVQRQVPMPVTYDGMRFDLGFRADLLVEDAVIVELKSVQDEHPVHKKQVLTYIKLADKRLGLLINFGARLVKDGITRVVNGLREAA